MILNYRCLTSSQNLSHVAFSNSNVIHMKIYDCKIIKRSAEISRPTPKCAVVYCVFSVDGKRKENSSFIEWKWRLIKLEFCVLYECVCVCDREFLKLIGSNATIKDKQLFSLTKWEWHWYLYWMFTCVCNAITYKSILFSLFFVLSFPTW